MTRKIAPATIRLLRASATDRRERAVGYVTCGTGGLGAAAGDALMNRNGGGLAAGIAGGGLINRSGGLAADVEPDAATGVVGGDAGRSSFVPEAGSVRAPQVAQSATPWSSYESEVSRHLPHRVTIPGRQAPSSTLRHSFEGR